MWTLAASLLLFVQDEKPLPKIAEIDGFTGSVEVTSVKGTARKPTRFGTRLRNAEIRDEDRIKTGEGSQAVILFPDASRFTLKEKSEIQILQKQLPKPTPQGETVGRRVKVIVGNLISEVIPSKDVRTDFDMQVAGSAAVRGTRLEITSTGASATIEVTDGTVRYYHLKYDVVMNILREQKIRFTEGSLIIEVLNDGGLPVDGFIGTRPFGMNGNDKVTVDDNGATLHGTIGQGPITLDGADTSNPFDAPKGTGAADEHVDIFPGMPTAITGPGSTQDTFPAASDLLAGTLLQDQTTILSTSPLGFQGFEDTFTRSNGADVGNAWTELIFDGISSPVAESGFTQWQLQNGTATFNNSLPSFFEGNLRRFDIPNLPTFEAEAMFRYNGSISFNGIGVNYNPVTDKGMFLEFDAGVGTMELEDGLGNTQLFPSITIGSNTDFILRLTFDGTQL